jgi:hypothetical protein
MAICSILKPFGIFYSHLVYFMVIWYIFAVLVSCSKKNLATLLVTIPLPCSGREKLSHDCKVSCRCPLAGDASHPG